MDDPADRVRAFRQKNVLPQAQFYAALGQGQKPETFILTCLDSRVVINNIMNSAAGEVLQHRNPGNLLPQYNPANPSLDSSVASLEFALSVLSIKHIVIMGHTDCGAMKARLNGVNPEEMPALSHCLQATGTLAEDVIRDYPHLKDNPQELATAAACENVLLQVKNLKTYPDVRQRVEAGTLRISGWMYEISSGIMYEAKEKEGTTAFIPLNPLDDDTHSLPTRRAPRAQL